MSMNNLHSDHDLYQAVHFPGLQAFSWCEHRQEEHRDIFHNLLHSRNSLTLGARQESLSPRECSEMERKIFFFLRMGGSCSQPGHCCCLLSLSLGCWGATDQMMDSSRMLHFVSPLLNSGKWGRAVHPADVGPHMFILQNSWLLTLALAWQENTTAAAHCWWQLLLWELNSFCTP